MYVERVEQGATALDLRLHAGTKQEFVTRRKAARRGTRGPTLLDVYLPTATVAYSADL